MGGRQEWGGGWFYNGADGKFFLRTWQRDANPIILWRPPYIASPPFLKFCPPSTPAPLPFPLQPPPHFLWCAISLDGNMDLYMSSLGTLVPGGAWCVFYATKRRAYCGLTHSVVSTGPLVWFHTHTHTHANTQHTQEPVDDHSHINIYLHHLLCAHSSYLYYIKWLNE